MAPARRKSRRETPLQRRFGRGFKDMSNMDFPYLMVKCKFLRVQNGPEEIAENVAAFVARSERFLNGGDFFIVGATIESSEKNGFGELRVIFAVLKEAGELAIL